MGLVAAAGTAIASITVAGALETVAAVGAVLSVVGTVTKSPVLSKVGMGLGIVGGVGALATSAMGIGSAALFGSDAIGDAGAAAGAVGADTVVAGTNSVGADLANSDIVDTMTGVSSSAGDTVASGVAGSDLTDATGLGSGLQDVTAAAGNPASAVPPPTGAGTGAATAVNPLDPGDQAYGGSTQSPTTVAAASTAPPTPTGTANVPQPTPSAANVPQPAPDSSTLDKLVAYANKNPIVAYGALQAGGTLLSGLTSTLTPAQVSALNAQAAQNNAAAALTTQQTANLAMPKAVASSAPVTGTPAALVPQAAQQAGLINQAPGVA